MKFIKVMLCRAIPYFCTKKCIRVPHRVPNFRKLCGKPAFLRFLSPFRTFSRISRRDTNTLGGDCSIRLSYGNKGNTPIISNSAVLSSFFHSYCGRMRWLRDFFEKMRNNS